MTTEQLLAHIDELLKGCVMVARPISIFQWRPYGDDEPVRPEQPPSESAPRPKEGNLGAEGRRRPLPSVDKRIASDVLSDFVALARETLQQPGDGPKNAAAVLAAAAYEDTLRRMAGGPQKDLDEVITDLKKSRQLVASQLGIAVSFLNFRNRALHANWETIHGRPWRACWGLCRRCCCVTSGVIPLLPRALSSPLRWSSQQSQHARPHEPAIAQL